VTQTIANCVNLTGCPTSTAPADPNTQSVTTTESYDALDRVTSENVPLDLNKAQHTVTASFYDADGRVTRTVPTVFGLTAYAAAMAARVQPASHLSNTCARLRVRTLAVPRCTNTDRRSWSVSDRWTG
jgi:hypothetical protein